MTTFDMTTFDPYADATPDIPKLRKYAEWATDQHERALRGERSEWNQAAWCGTACCIAGRVTLDEGWELGVAGSILATRGKDTEPVPNIAQAALGLTVDQRSALFSGANDIWDVWRIVARISGGEIVPPVGYKRAPKWDKRHEIAEIVDTAVGN